MAHHVRAYHNGTNADISNATNRIAERGPKVAKQRPTIKAPKKSTNGASGAISKSSKTKDGARNIASKVKMQNVQKKQSLKHRFGLIESSLTEKDLQSVSQTISEQFRELEPSWLENEDSILSMMSEILTREPVEENENVWSNAGHFEYAQEYADNGLLFLAAGSDDATDAEMESLAHSDGSVHIPDHQMKRSPNEGRETMSLEDIILF